MRGPHLIRGPTVVSALRKLTCHTGSHSIYLPPDTSWYSRFIDPRWGEGWVNPSRLKRIACFWGCAFIVHCPSQSKRMATFQWARHFDGGAYLLSVAALPLPSPKEGRYKLRLGWPSDDPGIEPGLLFRCLDHYTKRFHPDHQILRGVSDRPHLQAYRIWLH